MKLSRVCTAVTLMCIAGCANHSAKQFVAENPGARLYRSLCASCHGKHAHGDGPVASSIKTGVPDLTLLAQRNGGPFPSYDVRRAIDGRYDHAGHGSRGMPVWGWSLYDPAVRDQREARARADDLIDDLVGYLESIQQ